MKTICVQAAEHAIVYRDVKTFAAWPFTGGLWEFADGEIVAGFTRAPADYSDPETLGHGRVELEHGEHVMMRWNDGGRVWPAASLMRLHTRQELDEKVAAAPLGRTTEGGWDPTADGYLLLAGHGNPGSTNPARVWTMTSTDHGRTWNAPVRLPTWQPGSDQFTWSFATGRPSYVVREDGMLLLFGCASRIIDRQRWGIGAVPVVYASWDGGASWGFLAEMEMVPAQPMGVTPFPLILSDGDMLCAVRRQYSSCDAFTQVYRSTDGGRSWSFLSRVNDWGAPANLVQLPDGRLVCVYGYRQQPWGIRARVSEDQGRTWGYEIVLRDDGGSWDLGYPRTLLLKDGTLLTVYYFNSKNDAVQQNGGVRYIAATRWTL